jgi:TPP-dependent trihydroxycyclohexane-1,2-dione (THcHDO) dehydratase
MSKTVAEMLIERLIDWGVDTIFGFPGDGINGIFEALRTNQEKLKFIQVRHEEAAAFAAVGYANTPGVSACAWRLLVQAVFICSTVCMTPSATASLCWRLPGTLSMI